ncbi:MAG: hypothetical protein RIS94_1868 [Pseudomonadota bacterium]|jgi:hypothetical protein
MPPKYEAPRNGGATRDKLAGVSRSLPTLNAYRAQTLILAHAVRPEWAAMLAGLAFGGQAHG